MQTIRVHGVFLCLLYLVACSLAGFAVDNLSLDLAVPSAMLLGISVQYGWALFVGIKLKQTFPKVVRLNVLLFVGAMAWSVSLAVFFIPIIEVAGGESLIWRLGAFVFVVASVLVQFSVLWMAAKALVESRSGERVGFDSVLGSFVLFFFFPIGVFFIQNQLRQMFPAARQ